MDLYLKSLIIPKTQQNRFRQSNNNDGEYDAGDDISDDNGENDENTNLCECYNTWRRASNDGDDDDELHDTHTGTSTKKHKSFHHGQNNGGTDSGCDSDCPENISELCKKFDENLSEQDVSLYITTHNKNKNTNRQQAIMPNFLYISLNLILLLKRHKKKIIHSNTIQYIHIISFIETNNHFNKFVDFLIHFIKKKQILHISHFNHFVGGNKFKYCFANKFKN